MVFSGPTRVTWKASLTASPDRYFATCCTPSAKKEMQWPESLDGSATGLVPGAAEILRTQAYMRTRCSTTRSSTPRSSRPFTRSVVPKSTPAARESAYGFSGFA